MAVRAIMYGCGGRMGRMISSLAKEDEAIDIVAGIDLVAADDLGYPVFQSIEACDVDADVIIDFSSSKITDGLLDYCEANKMPIVLCTTGLSDEQIAHVKAASEKCAILRSANMSLGINLLMKLVKEAAATLAENGFDIEIVEKHHNQKLDAPSGTAIALANSINEEMDEQYHYVYDRSQVRQKREKTEIGISAVRGGSIVGDHDVIFAGLDEVVTISHTAYSRAIFGRGAIAAAKFLAGKESGLYTMSDVIG